MLQPELFIGFMIDEAMKKALAIIDSRVLKIFVNPQGPYLQQIVQGNSPYLGKYREDRIIDLEQLQLSSKHIYSLVKKLLPNYPIEDKTLFLLALSSYTPKSSANDADIRPSHLSH